MAAHAGVSWLERRRARDTDRPEPRIDATEVVVHLTGEHDLATLPELAKLLAAAVVLDDADWVLDLRRVTFMDLLSVRLLSQTRVLFHQQSRALRLQAPTPSVQHTFDLLGVDGLLGPGWRRTTRAGAMDLRRRTQAEGPCRPTSN